MVCLNIVQLNSDPKTLKTHPIDKRSWSFASKIPLCSLKKLIVSSLFFHFLLAFHGQFVLLFLNEEFLENGAHRTGLQFCFDRSRSKTERRRARKCNSRPVKPK